MNVREVDRCPHQQPAMPDPVPGLALAAAVAAFALWMAGPTEAVEAFLTVLAFLHLIYTRERQQT